MLNSAVVVGALGYFVDIYDLVLFSIVRVKSLQSLGVPSDQLLEVGVSLLNLQMGGMLVGGLIWGILGDKKGRLSVLFGSIFLYSAANIANAFITSVEWYGILRFIAGVGLAGELGAAITLVSEILPKDKRGLGTSIVAAIGICGAVLAAFVGETFEWQTAYLVGGVLGIALLVLRIGTYESGLFHESLKKKNVSRGDLFLLFANRERLVRYACCILIGVPIWYVIGILVTFSPELARAIGIVEPISAGKAILWSYVGLAVGDIGSGVFSQYLKSRKRAVSAFLGVTSLGIAAYFLQGETSAAVFYGVCWLLGFGTGYWAMFVTVAAEQFGTNLRATVTTSVPNFVRGSVVPLTLFFKSLQGPLGLKGAALWVGIVAIGVAYLALSRLGESYSRDLDFIEE